jgi:hypothetical protein
VHYSGNRLFGEMLRTLQENPELVQHYRGDFDLDIGCLLRDFQAGDWAIWVVRETGTHLFPTRPKLGYGDLSDNVRAILKTWGAAQKWFLIHVEHRNMYRDFPELYGSVRPITDAQAVRLAQDLTERRTRHTA